MANHHQARGLAERIAVVLEQKQVWVRVRVGGGEAAGALGLAWGLPTWASARAEPCRRTLS